MMIRHIQKRTPGSDAIPLFLFHDASGTISNYYGLASLGRDVYAVAAPRTAGGMDESLSCMSRRYYAAIKSLVSSGRILLGGWSMGGMIALQVAWIFSRDPKVTVDGIIMVDSPFPAYDFLAYSDLESPGSDDVSFSESYSNMKGTRNELERALLRSVHMLHNWQMPVWKRHPQPPTVMLYAKDRVVCEEQPALSFVDQFRDDPSLGWNGRSGSIVDKSFEIEGHHFNLFEPRNVTSVTHAVAAVAREMDLSDEEDDF